MKIRIILLEKEIIISSVTDFEMSENKTDKHQFILNYSSIDTNKLRDVLYIIGKVI